MAKKKQGDGVSFNARTDGGKAELSSDTRKTATPKRKM